MNEIVHTARWWERSGDRVVCHLCPRACRLKPGARGFCYGRQATTEGLVASTYGHPSGMAVDPIEKKPLYHFFPGSQILSFGTIGCNLNCQFCQNWNISKPGDSSRLGDYYAPEDIVSILQSRNISSVAFTYNEPIVFAEYAIDTARLCRERSIKTVAVTAGSISRGPREEFFSVLDAANIDLKYFRDESYRRFSGVELKPILETIAFVAKTKTWLEITTLIIPGINDSTEEIGELAQWMADNCGSHVPLHLSAFHPDFRMLDRAPTSVDILERARETAMSKGLTYVYIGNVATPTGRDTLCPSCGNTIIKRPSYRGVMIGLDTDSRCQKCGRTIEGRFAVKPPVREGVSSS